VANPDALISWVLGFGDGAEILSPPSLRARLVAHLTPITGARDTSGRKT
jgi:predicted DNA-binding transcriptional regulator YafY